MFIIEIDFAWMVVKQWPEDATVGIVRVREKSVTRLTSQRDVNLERKLPIGESIVMFVGNIVANKDWNA